MERSLSPDPTIFAQVWRRVMPQDRPDCPFTLTSMSTAPAVPLPAPEPAPSVCLGPTSAADLPRLELLLLSVTDARRCYQSMASRTGSRLFSQLASEKQRQTGQLSAAHYLITGRDFPQDPTPIPRPVPMPLALRERFHAEQRQASVFLISAGKAQDLCLAALYRQLAHEDRQAALRLWDVLARQIG